MIKIITKSEEETKKFAAKVAKVILRPSEGRSRKEAIVLGLFGDLGAGKTTFCQGFASGLGISENIHSPTFVIMKNYKLKAKSYQLIHIDAYRLQNPKELLDLGWDELIENPRNIILVEWADKIQKILPKNYIQVKLEYIDKNKRKIFLRSTPNILKIICQWKNSNTVNSV